jgi:PAS domain S-box-containing protein
MTPAPLTLSDGPSSLAALESGGVALLDHALVAAFLENIPAYVYFKDRQSRFIAVSGALVRYFGCTDPIEIIGRTDFDFFSQPHASATFESEQRLIRTGEPIVGKLEMDTWPDGRVTWVMTNKMPLRDEFGEIIGTFGLGQDVTAARKMEADLGQAQKNLIDASRVAGMAEVATNVLHNVGNVLSSLNVSASLIATGLRQSRAGSLTKVTALLREHRANLGAFLTHDAKGRRIPEFIASLARANAEERDLLLREIASLHQNVDHIKDIVSMQQAYATMVGVVEPLDPVVMLEDSLRMNAGALVRHEVRVVRDYKPAPPMLAEKAKVLQILVNLIRNAKYACDEGEGLDKVLTLRIAPSDPDHVTFIVQDNGIGIPAENLTRIFAHGFTTRKQGHGFGLHSSANAAREMKGSLTAFSAGSGHGATFTLVLPAAPRTAPVP